MPLPFSIHQDEKNLQCQSLWKDYQKHASDLVLLARHVYLAAISLVGPPIEEQDILDALTTTLFRDGVFELMVNSRPHILPDLHLGYAEALARVLLTHHWNEISKS